MGITLTDRGCRHNLELTEPAFGPDEGREPRPRLRQVERWYRSLQQHQAFREHVMVPFGELRGRLDY